MSENPIPESIANEEIVKKQTMLDRVLERRGLNRTAVEYVRTWVQFPDVILTPTNSNLKRDFLEGFMKDLVPDSDSTVMRIRVSSNVHEQPFGPETREGAEHRTANAIAKAQSGKTDDPELDAMLQKIQAEGKQCGYVGAIENGMVEGRIDDEGNVVLDVSKKDYDSSAEHFDVAYTIVDFPGCEQITVVSPPEEAVRFDPQDANASAAEGFNVTAGEKMRERLEKQGVFIDKQNWHGYTIQQEIAQAKQLRAAGQSTKGLHTEEFAGFDRYEQLTGVLFDAFYKLAQKREAASQGQKPPQSTPSV